jgi:hypothetical protein
MSIFFGVIDRCGHSVLIVGDSAERSILEHIRGWTGVSDGHDILIVYQELMIESHNRDENVNYARRKDKLFLKRYSAPTPLAHV